MSEQSTDKHYCIKAAVHAGPRCEQQCPGCEWHDKGTVSIPSATLFAPPTDAEISAYRDLFRRELDKRMDTNHPSASPSTESHAVALRAFVHKRREQSDIEQSR